MKFLDTLSPHAHWAIRLSLAGTFIYHGAGKFPPDGFAQGMGLPLAVGWAVAVAEVLGGALLIAGGLGKAVLTRLGGLLVIAIMVGAIVLVHGKNGWDTNAGGMEFQVLMLACGLYFLTRGNRV